MVEQLILKKAIFYPTEIVIIKKKGNVTISVDDIESIFYHKPNVWHYLAGLFVVGSMSTILEIKLNKEIKSKKVYCLIVKQKDVLKMKEFFQKEIFII